MDLSSKPISFASYLESLAFSSGSCTRTEQSAFLSLHIFSSVPKINIQVPISTRRHSNNIILGIKYLLFLPVYYGTMLSSSVTLPVSQTVSLVQLMHKVLTLYMGLWRNKKESCDFFYL